MIESKKRSDFPEVSFQRVKGTHQSKQKAKEGAQGKETEYRLLNWKMCQYQAGKKMAKLKGKKISFFQDNFDLCVSENKRKIINGK